jgi:alpha-methylacyl-CoA racemase
MNDDNQAAALLQGLQVIELQSVGPVPFAARLLADLGADVLRLHAPAAIELGLPLAERFDVLTHRKRTQHVDLKSDAGREQALAQIERADVLLEGFRPGVLERLGLAPQVLLDRNPSLVIGRLSGWGARGPWAARAGHDINYLALSGALHAIGRREHPVPPLNLVADFGGGAMHLAVGVLAALVRRAASGRGGVVESSILAGTHGLTGLFHGMLAGQQWTLSREDNILDGGTPYYRCYRTRDGRHVAVGAIEQRFYRELLALTGLATQLDARHQHDRSRWPQAIAAFEAAFAVRTRDEWAALAIERDACVAPVLDFAEAAADAHNRANGWFDDGALGTRDAITWQSS